MSADDRNDAGEIPPLLVAYKADAGPPAGKKDENWAAITAAVGAPAVVPRPHVLTPAKGLFGLAVVGIASLLAGTLAVRAGLFGDDATVAAAPAEMPAETVTAPVAAPTVVSPIPGEAASGELPTPASTARRPARETEPPAAPMEAVAPIAPEPAHGLAEELAMLRDARAALARGDADGALEALDRHAAGFATGTLATEREHTRISALCLANRRAEAERVAAALDPSPAVERALARCGAP